MMTSISGLSASFSSFQAAQSPRAQIDARIAAAAQNGTISTEDQSALSGALDAIDSSLESARSSGTKPSGDVKEKINSLIQAQVDSGKLTEDQATELQSFFAQGPDGKGGPEGAGAPPPPPPGGGAPDASSGSAGSSSADSDSDDDADTAQTAALKAFLQALSESAPSFSYGETSNTGSIVPTGLVYDTQA